MSTKCIYYYLTFVLFLLAISAWAWEEPTGFRGIPWGAKLSDVKRQLPELRCDKQCRGYLMVGEIRAFTLIIFDSGGMDAVSLTFPIKHFPLMREIFIERYGSPSTRNKTTVQNRMGAQFENEVLHWYGERVHIQLEQYGSRLTDSSAILLTKENMRAGNEQTKQKVKSGKKDL